MKAKTVYHKIIVLLIMVFHLTLDARATHTEKSINKAEKLASKNFKGIEIIKEPVMINHSDYFNEKADTIYGLFEKDGVLKGFLVLSSAKGRFEEFDFMIVYAIDMQIVDLNILVYRSEYGYQVSSRGWLKQFLMLPHGSVYTYGQNIDAISGATYSGRSLTENINRLNLLMGSINK
jgi:hypothetical protein